MNDFDDKLKRALENGKAVELDQEESLRQMIAQTFRSKLRWIMILLWVEGFIIFGLAIWMSVRLYYAQEMKQVVVYAMAVTLCAVFTVLIKTVGWQQMNRYSVMREIKRLELRIAELKDGGRSA
jgi:uncharacterized membrane protein YhfC